MIQYILDGAGISESKMFDALAQLKLLADFIDQYYYHHHRYHYFCLYNH